MPLISSGHCLRRCCANFQWLTSPEGPYRAIALRFYSVFSEHANAKACKTKLVNRAFSSSLLVALGALLMLAVAMVRPVDLREDILSNTPHILSLRLESW